MILSVTALRLLLGVTQRGEGAFCRSHSFDFIASTQCRPWLMEQLRAGVPTAVTDERGSEAVRMYVCVCLSVCVSVCVCECACENSCGRG